MNDLVEIDGYKIRLLTLNDIINNLGYERSNTATYYSYRKSSNDYEWLEKWNYCMYDNCSFWTMISYEDFNYLNFVVWGNGVDHSEIFNRRTIRPVINLKKCAISN